jgi:hypothetical protein
MGYYMRYIVADDRPVTADAVATFFTGLGPAYKADVDDDDVVVEHDGHPVAHVTFATPGDGLFDEEREELIEFAEDADDGPEKARVLATLRGARGIVAVQVLMGGRDTEAVLGAIDPLWAWLFAERKGLMQADGEGYYAATGQVLEVE